MAAIALCLALTVGVGQAIGQEVGKVRCDIRGDAMGWTIASGGDFDGDGVDDFAVSAPCTRVSGNPAAGKVVVYSGVDASKLATKKGGQPYEWRGVGLAFVEDLNGDGRDEIAIGSPGYELDDGTEQAGRVTIYRKFGKRTRLLREVFGEVNKSFFGWTVADVGDVNGDGTTDYAVGAPDDRIGGTGNRRGRVRIISGKSDSAVLGVLEGQTAGEDFGTSLDGRMDLSGDGAPDILAGTGRANMTGSQLTGVVRSFADATEASEFLSVQGAKNDELGADLAVTDDHNNDQMADFIAGSPGADDQGIVKAGQATLFSSLGNVLFNVGDPSPQEKAHFGSSVASIGDINNDQVTDFAVGAVKFDKASNGTTYTDAGRVVAISGVSGAPIWSRSGGKFFQSMGHELQGGVDFNGDGTPDVLVGSVGAAPKGRRGAGSLRIFNGKNGNTMESITGRRGLETRFYAAGADGRVKAFDPEGKFKKLNGSFNARSGETSVAVIGDSAKPAPGGLRVAVGTGAGATGSDVKVFASDSRNKTLDEFIAYPDISGAGANVAAGRIGEAEEVENLVVAQADSADNDVLVRIFTTLGDSNDYFPISEFLAYRSSDQLVGSVPIAAGGASIAIGNVTGDKREEIIVGTVSGVPLVRVYDGDGGLLEEWLAYDPINFAGVNVAVVDLEGDGGQAEIVTVPRNGAPQVKAFRGDGQAFTMPGGAGPVDFLAFDETFTDGVSIAGADVDFDGKQEILATQREEPGPTIKAFEADGTSAKGFKDRVPFSGSGAAIAGTDKFIIK